MSRWAVGCLLLAALAVPSSRAAAQGVQIFELRSTLFPDASFSEGAGLDAIGMQTFSATLSVPQVLSKDKAYLYHRLGYSLLDVRYEGLPDGAAPDRVEQVHRAQYELTFSGEVRPDWWLTVLGSVELAGDFHDISFEDLRPEGALLVTRNLRKDLVLGGGLGLINTSGELQPVPVIYFRQSSERFRTEVILPDRASFYYLPSRSWQVGLIARYDGNGFDVDPGFEVQTSAIVAGPSVQWRFTRLMSLQVEGGAAFVRSFEGFLDPGREGLPDELEVGPFFGAGLQFWVVPRQE